MRITTYIVLSVSLISGCSEKENKSVRIMPVGNSITAGEHYNFPAKEDRAGYRKHLYDMLKEEGFSFDFVGSTTHGKRENPEYWYDWNSESYPGWTINSIADTVLKVLHVYKPDILLMHVGTNGKNWDEKPAQLETFLDGINEFSVQQNYPVTVFLALILDFFESNPEVSVYNDRVKEMVSKRENDFIKIVLVDMEKGAGIDYTDNDPDPSTGYPGGDMWGRKYPGVKYDFAHPNDRGNVKMAIKWFHEVKPYLEKY